MSSTPELPQKTPITPSERVQVTPMGPQHRQGPEIYLFADVLDEIIRHAAYRHDTAATLLVGKHYQGPQGPFVEVQGFAESVYVGRTLDLYGPLRDGHRRQREELAQQQQRVLGWSHSLPGQGVRATPEGYLLHRTFFNRPEQLLAMMDVQRQELALYRLDEQGQLHNVGFHLISMRGQALPFGEPGLDPEALPELDIGDTAVPPSPLPRIDQTSTVRAMEWEEEEEAPVPVLPSLHEDTSLDDIEGFDSLEVSEEEFAHSQTAIAHAVRSRDEEVEEEEDTSFSGRTAISPALLYEDSHDESLGEDEMPSGGTAVSYALAASQDEDSHDEDSLDQEPLEPPRGGTMVAHALMDRDEDSQEDVLAPRGPASGDTLVAHGLPSLDLHEAAEPTVLLRHEDTREVARPQVSDPVVDDLLAGLGDLPGEALGEDTSEGWNFFQEKEKKPQDVLGQLKQMPLKRYRGQGKTAFVAREVLPASESGDEDASPEKFDLQRRLERIKRLRKIQENSGAPAGEPGSPEAQDTGEDDGHDS